jgi:hypothetical protein
MLEIKNRKYHTVGTVPKFERKIVERGKIKLKSGGVKLVVWSPHLPPLFVNLHKANTCLFQTQKLVSWGLGLDSFHCTFTLAIIVLSNIACWYWQSILRCFFVPAFLWCWRFILKCFFLFVSVPMILEVFDQSILRCVFFLLLLK